MQLYVGASWVLLGLLVIFFLVLFRRSRRVALALLLVLGGGFGFLILLRSQPAARVERLSYTYDYPRDPPQVSALEAQEQRLAQMEAFATEMGAYQNAHAFDITVEQGAPATASQPAGAAVVAVEGDKIVVSGVGNGLSRRDVAARAAAELAKRLDELAQREVAINDVATHTLRDAMRQLDSAQRRAVAAQAVAARAQLDPPSPVDGSAITYTFEVPADSLTNLARQMRLQTLTTPGGVERKRLVMQVAVLVGVLVGAALVLKAATRRRRPNT